VAALLYLLADVPTDVTTFEESDADVVSCSLRFAGGSSAHLHLSRVDAARCARLTIVGSERSIIFDDLEPGRQEADVTAHGQRASPLRTACETFLTSINTRYPLVEEARAAAAVVCVLEAIERSFRSPGVAQAVTTQPATSHLENVVPISAPVDHERHAHDIPDDFHRSKLPR
jgi:predicted dehydrogenase